MVIWTSESKHFSTSMSSEESKSTVEINISSQRGIKYQGEFPPFKKKEKYLEKPFKRLINFNSVSCLANFIANNRSFLEAKT